MSLRKLFQLSLIGAVLSCAQAAMAQPLGGFCQSRPKINSVKYLGKVSGDDQVEVRWSTGGSLLVYQVWRRRIGCRGAVIAMLVYRGPMVNPEKGDSRDA